MCDRTRACMCMGRDLKPNQGFYQLEIKTHPNKAIHSMSLSHMPTMDTCTRRSKESEPAFAHEVLEEEKVSEEAALEAQAGAEASPR